MARPGQGLAQQPRHGPGDHTNTLYVVTVVTPCTQDQDRADLHSTASTPTPPTAHPGLDTVVKDENGQDISASKSSIRMFVITEKAPTRDGRL